MGMLFKYDNRVEVYYGVYHSKRLDSNGVPTPHRGIDVDSINDSTIYNVLGGYFKSATAIGTLGNTVEIYYNKMTFVHNTDKTITIHPIPDQTFRFRYGHCKSYLGNYKQGDKVEEGTPIAIMGQTGNAWQDSQGDHVHFQVDAYLPNDPRSDSNGWYSVDPTPFCGMSSKELNYPYYYDEEPWGEPKFITFYSRFPWSRWNGRPPDTNPDPEDTIILQNHVNALTNQYSSYLGQLTTAVAERDTQYAVKQQKEAAEQAEYVRLRATETTADALIATTTADMGNVETEMTELFGL